MIVLCSEIERWRAAGEKDRTVEAFDLRVETQAQSLCGLVAAATHIAVDSASPVPTVGASGAISGIMGAYLLLYPQVRVRMLFIFIIFFKVIAIPAWLVLLWWFAIQILTGLPQLMPMRPDVSGGVAVWAHVGGFVAGVILIKLFENRRLVAKRDEIREIEHPHHRYTLPRL